MPKKWLVFSLSVLLCLDLAAAEDSDDLERQRSTGEQETLVETIEVVGHVESRRSVQSVTVFHGGEIDRLADSGIKGLLNHSPGFLVLSGGHPGQFAYSYARGASVNQSLFLIDGFKINDPSSSIGVNTSLFTSSLFETAEIVRGPLSNLHGSSAMGGVVNLRSQRSEAIEAALFWGSHATYEGRINALKHLGKFFLHANASWLHYSDGVENDEFVNRGAVLKAGYGDDHLQTGILLFANLADSGIPFNLGQPTLRREYAQDNTLVGLPLTVKFNQDHILRLRFSHQRNSYRFTDPEDTWTPYYRNRSTVNSGEIVYETSLFSPVRLQAGIEGTARRVRNEDTDSQPLEEQDTHSLSAFFAAGLELQRFTLSASIRHDRYEFIDPATSPQIGLSYAAADWLRLRGSYSRSFRAPTLPELFNPMWGNPDLQPERAASWEVGAELFLSGATVSLVYFDSAYTQLIGYDPTTWTFANIDEADISGLELGARVTLWEAVHIHAAYTRLDTHDIKNDQELLRRPKHAFSLMIAYDHRRFSLSGEMIYVGRRLDYDELLWSTGESPAFDTFNVVLRVPINPKLSLIGKVSNAFDRTYEEILGYPAPGRRAMLGISYKML